MIGSKFAAAFVKAQGQIEGAKKGKRNPGFNSKYADLSACWDACRDALQENDIGIIQLPVEAGAGRVGLRTTLLHVSGEAVEADFSMPLKDATNPQAAGSALTYARRYALCAAIGICPEDDDGNAAASAGKAATPKGTTETVVKVVSPEFWKSQFLAAKNKEEQKAVYFQLKNSAEVEPLKSSLLTEWGKEIKKNA